MSSDMGRFVLSSLTLADPPGHCRLHSRGFTLFTRLSAAFLVLSLPALLRTEAIVVAAVHVALVLVLAALLWSRPKSVVATSAGLVLRSGKKRKLVPWSRVRDVRELPWIRFNPPWYPKMWQVDLDTDEHFDFCGIRSAREIVKQFVQRSEDRER